MAKSVLDMNLADPRQTLTRLGTAKQLAKGAVIFQQGREAAKFYSIERGIVKAFYSTHDGRQFTKSFIQRGECIASLTALKEGAPSTFTAVCITDCSVLEIGHAALIQALSQDAELARLLNSVLLSIAAKKERREYELLCLSAEERYHRFCLAEATLAEHLSQEEIARYLGITPVSLSRIRARIRANKQHLPSGHA